MLLWEFSNNDRLYVIIVRFNGLYISLSMGSLITIRYTREH